MEEYPVSRKPVLFRARLILPMQGPPVENGAVAVERGRIVAVGPYSLLRRTFSGRSVDLGEVALLPALANAHTHLELSVLRFRLTPTGSFVTWVKSLLRKRAEFSLEEVRRAAGEALKELWREGVGLLGEVGNTGLTLALLREAPFFTVYFREIIDFRGTTELKDFLARFPEARMVYALSPHAPYTVSPVLIQAIKSWTRRRGRPFSIHVAESPEETLFLRDGSGPIRFLLEERGQFHPEFRAPGLSPVAYLDRLGVLDDRTICVHVVQVSPEDIEILARRRVRPCLCPRSNVFLGVGLPPLPDLLRAGLRPCLGTDSLASNDRLSILSEMEVLYYAYPEIPPETYFLMGTLWGAEALGRRDLGALAPGFRPEMIALSGSFSGSDPVRGLLEGPKKVEARIYEDL
ncbi:amidohydrolase family protein [Thermosulfurimonas sp. F29]|uniref:amidohydrolase family protein n=1 Tax=Thermosulfurimonas sp. F29 TaxID=2867247 RepID=UPI001C8298AE|nr:amidohydrolase family protein [Thermosulfurimonas sp. F29]MBX6422433.1 amidohydrolase family protein [Thermosulfurimonas sp. F29]